MLEIQFALQNFHFVICLFGGLVFFSIAWLYFDAWLVRKSIREVPKFLGYFILSLSFITYAPLVEKTILSTPLLGIGTIALITSVLRITGYILVIVGLIQDPIQPKPQQVAPALTSAPAIGFLGKATSISFIAFPLLAATIAGLYLRRATIGLERHLRPVAVGFIVLAIAEALHLSAITRNFDSVSFSELTASYGPLWILEHIFLIVAIAILANWVFRYLLKRLQTQLFIIFTSFGLLIFLTVTLLFSVLLFSSLKGDVEKNLKTSVRVLDYAIEAKKSEALSDAQLIAQNPQIIAATISINKKSLESLTTEIISSKNQSYLLITLPTGEVIARPDNIERLGESVSDDKVFKLASAGKSQSSVVIENGVLSPVVSIRAGTPIFDGNKLIGTVITGTIIDNAFVDGIKTATDLDSNVYAGIVLSATTFIAPDGKTRYIGTSQNEGKLINDVFSKGKTFLGEIEVMATPYLVAVSPLKDSEGTSVGMLLIGREKTEVLQSISHAIEVAFILSVLLLTLSVFPIFLITRYLARQFK